MRRLSYGLVVAQVNFTPDFNALPGRGPIQQIINGVGAMALLLALIGIIIGGAMWGVGSLSSNYHQAAVGKRATLYSVVGAVIVGAAAALVNWAFSLGRQA
jgi:type IV secretory pathway VirB2 component (pilin)